MAEPKSIGNGDDAGRDGRVSKPKTKGAPLPAPSDSTNPEYAPRKDVLIKPRSADIEAFGRAFAENITSPAFASLRVIRAADRSGGYEKDMDVPTLMVLLHEQGQAVNAGNLAQAEAMLMNQATALQSIFTRLAERGMGCTDIAPYEANMRIALRAQAQCRANLETLAAIKNPHVVFAKQANVTTGPQQINNGVPSPARAREGEIPPSKLLELNDGERLDRGAKGAAGIGNPALATVGEINGAADGRGEASSQPQCGQRWAPTKAAQARAADAREKRRPGRSVRGNGASH